MLVNVFYFQRNESSECFEVDETELIKIPFLDYAFVVVMLFLCALMSYMLTHAHTNGMKSVVMDG